VDHYVSVEVIGSLLRSLICGSHVGHSSGVDGCERAVDGDNPRTDGWQ
jgi:hypothetical protein